jgi:hypothetical protein
VLIQSYYALKDIQFEEVLATFKSVDDRKGFFKKFFKSAKTPEERFIKATYYE